LKPKTVLLPKYTICYGFFQNFNDKSHSLAILKLNQSPKLPNQIFKCVHLSIIESWSPAEDTDHRHLSCCFPSRVSSFSGISSLEPRPPHSRPPAKCQYD